MRILGIFRGFPGLGRVVSGVTLLEELRDNFNCEVRAISYLQGNKYLGQRGFNVLSEVSAMDYCSIGLLPTNKVGVFIHETIRDFKPNLIIVDGEPLIIQSIKISHPNIKVVALLNPSDVDNPSNDREAMEYFNALYSLSDLAIVHGLRNTLGHYQYKKILSIPTIIRREIVCLQNLCGKNIYCVLGGGTVNSSQEFIESSLRIAKLCMDIAKRFSNREIHIVCSCNAIGSILIGKSASPNITIHEKVLTAEEIYSDAAIIITRSGRNTLSEVAFLGIPTISFVTGDCYRKEEQRQNIQSLNRSNIHESGLDITSDNLYNKMNEIMYQNVMTNDKFEYGNPLAINAIVSLIEETTEIQ